MICFFFPPFGSFLSEPLWDLWMRYTVVGTASYGRLFLPITLSEERKNLQEIHFKPPDQARRPTFASDKTKPGLTGDEAGETL